MSIPGISNQSIMSLGPNINNLRTKVSDFPKIMADLRLTPGDVSGELFQTYLPPLRMRSLAPPLPQTDINIDYQPPQVQIQSSASPSTTNILLSKAKAMKVYGG